MESKLRLIEKFGEPLSERKLLVETRKCSTQRRIRSSSVVDRDAHPPPVDSSTRSPRYLFACNLHLTINLCFSRIHSSIYRRRRRLTPARNRSDRPYKVTATTADHPIDNPCRCMRTHFLNASDLYRCIWVALRENHASLCKCHVLYAAERGD